MTAETMQPTAPVSIDAHREWMAIAEREYALFGEVVSGLSGDDWGRPTDCDLWTVRDLAGHVIGTMRSNASKREFLSQQREISRRSKATGENAVNVMTDVQVQRASGLAPDDIADEYHRLAPAALRGRTKTPALARRLVKIPVEMGSINEKWTLGYLMGRIFTRDLWMHRVDLSRAIDTGMKLSADHDGRIVADVVAEWARRHGEPYHLRLSGPAGGAYGTADVEPLEIDAVEFCRAASGRSSHPHPLMATEVPF